MKTTVIHHSADFDGLFCREIARKFLPDAELIGWDYGDAKIPFPKEGQVYVLDLSPDCFDRMPDITELTRLIWIDHHKSAIEKWPSEIAGYRIDGVAACRLAWQWFAFNLRASALWCGPEKQSFVARIVSEPLAVQLAGEYDIWDKRNPDAETFQFGLRAPNGGLTQEHWTELLDGDFDDGNDLVDVLLEKGALLQNYQQQTDAGVMGRSFQLFFEGLKFLALNTARCNSLTFAAKDVPDTGHDALLGFYWNGEAWTVSLYHARHRMDLDLSVIAVKYGGGGHRGACGFRATKLPFLT